MHGAGELASAQTWLASVLAPWTEPQEETWGSHQIWEPAQANRLDGQVAGQDNSAGTTPAWLWGPDFFLR